MSNQVIIRDDNTTVVRESIGRVTISAPGPQGSSGSSGSLFDSFETTSKNLKSYPYTINYSEGVPSSIVYDLGNSSSITKEFTYNSDQLLSQIVLSGDTLQGAGSTKTLTYNDNNELASISYS